MAGPAPGWYPDPWADGHQRYWDGSAWTGDAFPEAPVDPAQPSGSPATPPALPRVTPPPPQWTPPTPTARFAPPEYPGPVPAPTKPSWYSSGLGFVVLVVVLMLVAGSLALVGVYYSLGGRKPSHVATEAPFVPVRPTRPPAQTPTPSFPSLTPPSASTPPDPAASVLSGLVVTQSDVPATAVVVAQPGGDQVSGDPTLDLCNANYASDSLRTARLQVIAFGSSSQPFLSTEAVLYGTPAATDQAFAELKAQAAACPNTPVPSSTGGRTLTTKINAAPDGAWPAVATVDRLAFDLTLTDQGGPGTHNVVVYLRRGRVLVGVYFYQPDGAQPAVAGQTTLAGITNVFANRIAQLPASVVGG